MIDEKIIETGKRVLMIESEAINSLISKIDEKFQNAVEILYSCQGKVVVTGMGKSGIIGKKIASTLSSTGTPSLFLHPAEGSHGDLGMLSRGDVIIAISNSGETEELIKILPTLKRFNIKLISLTGNNKSTIARNSDVPIEVWIKEEACPMGLAPTASTTASLAMGDAIAVSLLVKRGFRKEDFAVFHPGGSLGKRLILRVEDVMHKGSDIPVVNEDAIMKDAILEISSKKMGITTVINSNGILMGVITDGDLRRLLEKRRDIIDLKVSEIMSKNPKTIKKEALAAEAVQIMEQYSITALISVSDDMKVDGITHLHDLLKIGIV